MREARDRPTGARARSRPKVRGPASRPGSRRAAGGARGPVTRTSAPRPPGRMTGRAAILAVVLVALALSYVIPLRIYLAQQAEIAELRSSQAEQRLHIADLEEEAARWSDDAYIRIQARKRQLMVEPGQVPLITFWEGDVAGDAGSGPSPPAPPERAWWDLLWSSVQEADRDDGAGPAGPTGAG